MATPILLVYRKFDYGNDEKRYPQILAAVPCILSYQCVDADFHAGVVLGAITFCTDLPGLGHGCGLNLGTRVRNCVLLKCVDP